MTRSRPEPRPVRAPATQGSSRYLAWGALGGIYLCVAIGLSRVESWVGGQERHAGDGTSATGRLAGRGGALSPLATGAPLAAENGFDLLGALEGFESGAAAQVVAPSRAQTTGLDEHGEAPHDTEGTRGQGAGAADFSLLLRRLGHNRSRWGDSRFLERYPDGSLAVEGEYLDGERAGDWTSWHPEGSVQLEGQYAGGERVGRWRSYHPNGQLQSEGPYSGGQREGSWVTYYSNGQVKEQGMFEGGLRTGPWQFFDRFGQPEARTGIYRFGRMLGGG